MGGICRAAAVALRTSRTTRHVRKSLHIFESRGKVSLPTQPHTATKLLARVELHRIFQFEWSARSSCPARMIDRPMLDRRFRRLCVTRKGS